MSINRENTVSWNRLVESGSPDSMGRVGKVPAAGFPKSVLCSFQPQSKPAQQKGEGLTPQRDALVISETYLDGRVGDQVTFAGVKYVVLSADPWQASPAHVEYWLAKTG